MGVTGLWPLLEPSGQRLDDLSALPPTCRKLSVDISLWLHQLAKGMPEDLRGGADVQSPTSERPA